MAGAVTAGVAGTRGGGQGRAQQQQAAAALARIEQQTAEAFAGAGVPVCDQEAERAVLVGMIGGQHQVMDAVEAALADDGTDFYGIGNGRLYRAILHTLRTTGEVDAGLLWRSVESDGAGPLLPEQPGSTREMVEGLCREARRSSRSVDAYVQIVRGLAARRRVAEFGALLQGKALAWADDADALLADVERSAMLLRGQTGKDRNLINFARNLPDALEQIKKRYRDREVAATVPTGFTELDTLLSGGLEAGELMILGARPKMGKSAAAMSMAWHVARAQVYGPPVFFSMEMPEKLLSLRCLTSEARVNAGRIRLGVAGPSEWERLEAASAALARYDLHLESRTAVTIPQIRADLHRVRAEHGKVGLVVVDYLQLMGTDLRSTASRYDVVTDNVQRLRDLASDFECPVVALSQLSREVDKREDKRPQRTDCRESGNVEQACSHLVFLYRPEYYAQAAKDGFRTDEEDVQQGAGGTAPAEEVEMILALSRNLSDQAVATARFTPAFCRFDNPGERGMF